MDLLRKKSVSEVLTRTPDQLRQCLTSIDLIFLGIGGIIGAGIFILTGIVAATKSGPSLVLSYIFAGLAAGFSALSYAELAATIGGCGSAYSYAYAGLGEIFAWIIGWDLLLEYSVSVSAVSVGWSSYFNDFLLSMGIHLPHAILKGPFENGLFNLPAFAMVLLLTILLMIGVKASARFNNLIVVIKLSVLLLFIVIASFHINPQNWQPFFPYGWQGMIKGASIIFFAYIGFDAVSTAAEEARAPQRNLPIGIIGSLIICTIVFIVVSLLLTGMVSYRQLNVSSPISHVLLHFGYGFAAIVISIGAIAGLTTVMLVMYFGLTRVFYAMSRDLLLPAFFAALHPRTQTPIRIISLSGVIIGLFSGLAPISTLAELVNVGTLFAFITVCAGVIFLRYAAPTLSRPFKTPWSPLIPALGILTCFYLIINLPWITLMRFVVWMIAGLILYFSYSRFRVKKDDDLPSFF